MYAETPLTLPPTPPLRFLGAFAACTTPRSHWAHITHLPQPLLRPHSQFMPLGIVPPSQPIASQQSPEQSPTAATSESPATVDSLPARRNNAIRQSPRGGAGRGLCPVLVAMESVARRWVWSRSGRPLQSEGRVLVQAVCREFSHSPAAASSFLFRWTWIPAASA